MVPLGRAKRDALELQLAILSRMSDLATAAFGLVAALAWNQAIQAVFRARFGDLGDAWPVLLGYALFVTVLAVLVIVWVGRVVARLRKVVERAVPTGPADA